MQLKSTNIKRRDSAPKQYSLMMKDQENKGI